MKKILIFSLFTITLLSSCSSGKSGGISDQFQPGQPFTPVLKIMNYNVLTGLNDSAREKEFKTYINELQPDVLAYQELNRFSPRKLQDLAGSYDHPYSVLLKRTGYPVGISSRFPIYLVKRMRKGLHHGALHVRIAGINYIVVHFSPLSAEKRLKEAELIRDYVNETGEDRFVILGDFNAHSEIDSSYYNEVEIRKYYSAENMYNGDLDYRTLAVFKDAGYADVWAASASGVMRGTFPTGQKGIPERIDYILLSPALRGSLKRADIPENEHTRFISDHYPVYADLRF